MISFLRRIIGSKFGALFALLFLALVAFAFAAGDVTSTGGFGSLTSFGGGSSTRIGSQSLSESELQSRSQRVFEQQRRENPGMQIGEFLAMGAIPNIYDQLVSTIALEEFARQQGIHVSKRMVDAQIASLPAFQDATGKFSQSTFRQLLSAQGVSEQALRDDISQQLSGQLLTAPAGFGTRLTDSLVLPYASLLLEARAGRIAAIPSAVFLPKDKPTDQQLKQFYASNAERYTIPEQRKLRYALVDVSRFDAAAAPPESEIAKYYADHKADYAARETRTISQLILPTETAAKKATGAATLVDAAKANGLSVATFKDVTKADFATKASSAAADLAFATAEGKIAGPVKLPLGWALVEVTGIQRIAAKPLDSVKPEIVSTLRNEKRKQMLRDFISKIEDGIANGGTFDEAVKDNGLSVETSPLLLSTGQSPDNPEYRASPDVMPLLKPAFDMEADDDPQFTPISPDQRYALLDVTDIVAPAPPSLEKVKGIITQHYILHEGSVKAKALALKIKAEVDKGTPLEKALASAGVPLPPVQKLAGRRADLLRDDQRPPAEVSIMFAMAPGTIKTMPISEERGTFLIMLDDIQ
ncbi:MAG: SurA N-terminal domain-containing protein, partial [Sphingobium sp.]